MSFGKVGNFLSSYNFIIQSNCAEINKDEKEHDSQINVNEKPVKVYVSNSIKSLNFKSISINKSSFIDSLQNVLKANKDLFVELNMIVHGFTYANSLRLIENIIKVLPTFSTRDNFVSNEQHQIIVNSDNLYDLIVKIIEKFGNSLIISCSFNNRNILLTFTLIRLLIQEDNQYGELIKFVPTTTTEYFIANHVYSGNGISKNAIHNKPFQELTIWNENGKSAFLVFNDCDIFSCSESYFETLPNICLIHESVYIEFLNYVQKHIKSNSSFDLSDKNRSWSMVRLNESSKQELIKERETIKESLSNNLNNLLIEKMDFFPIIITDKIQPQNNIFNNDNINYYYSFIITFRHLEEAVQLINSSIILNRSELYLWSENLQITHTLLNILKWNNIYTNSTLFTNFKFLDIKINSVNFSSNDKVDTNILNKTFNNCKNITGNIKKNMERFLTILNDNNIKEFTDTFMKTLLDLQYKQGISNVRIKPSGNNLIFCDNTSNSNVIFCICLSILGGNKVIVLKSKESSDNKIVDLLNKFKLNDMVKFFNETNLNISNKELSDDLPLNSVLIIGDKLNKEIFCNNINLLYKIYYLKDLKLEMENVFQTLFQITNLYVPLLSNIGAIKSANY